MILGDLFESNMKRVMDTVQDFVQLTDKEFTARHGVSPVTWVKQNQSLLSSIADQYPAIKKYIPAPDDHLFHEDAMVENLRKWFREKWVRFNPQGKIMGPCARGSDKEGKPKCLPQAKAHALGKKGRASAAAKKRREDPNPERRGAARNVATKVRENDAVTEVTWPATALRTPRRKTPEPNWVVRFRPQGQGLKIAAVFGETEQEARQALLKLSPGAEIVSIERKGLAEGSAVYYHVVDNNKKSVKAFMDSASAVKFLNARRLKDPTAHKWKIVTKKNAVIGEQGVAEGSEVAYVVSYFEKITGEKGEITVSAMSKDDAAEKAKKTVITHGYPIEVYWVKRAEAVDEGYKDYKAPYNQGRDDIDNEWDGQAERREERREKTKQEQEKKKQKNKPQGVAEGFLGDREYNRVMPFVKRIAGEVSDYDRDEFGEELWSLLDQKYGSKFAQSVLDDLDIYWDTYTELTDQQGVAETFVRPENVREQQAQMLARIYAELYWGDRSITERARTAREIFRALESGELDMATLKMEIRALEQEHDLDEGQLDEKQDACYHKVKARYKVWPSAYASGALVQCRKKGAANWGTGRKKKK